jgi:hypothetical protein
MDTDLGLQEYCSSDASKLGGNELWDPGGPVLLGLCRHIGEDWEND